MQYSLLGDRALALVALSAAKIGRFPLSFSDKSVAEASGALPHQRGLRLALVDDETGLVAAGERAVLRSLSALVPLAQLHGGNAFQEAEVDMWVEVALNELALGNPQVCKVSWMVSRFVGLKFGVVSREFCGDLLFLCSSTRRSTATSRRP